nr:reverse transcriptase domain-containing protein [Tanacetum cinerariifolium]
MSSARIERNVTQRIANAIKVVTIYEAKPTWLMTRRISLLGNIVSTALDTKYSVKLADEKTTGTDSMIQGKENDIANALSRKERAKPFRVRALVMTINSNMSLQNHEAQVGALKEENVKDENLHGMDKEFETRLDGTLYIRIRSW